MNPSPDNFPASSHSLWPMVLARDEALNETRKTYEKRCAELNEAVTSTKSYLAKVEQARDDALAATQKTVDYLQAVEKDSAERLKSIEFHQGKLKEAYGDLERNVAYLKVLEAEIQAHIRAGAEKEARIADLTAQLAQARQA